MGRCTSLELPLPLAAVRTLQQAKQEVKKEN
jgi:hypothetical protein